MKCASRPNFDPVQVPSQAGGDPGLAAPVDQAVKDINAARAVSRHITAYLATTNLGEQIVSGVNGTLRVVNEQAQTRSPSIDAVLQSGSAFSAFMNTGSQLSSKLQAARSQLSTPNQTGHGVSQGLMRSLADQIAADRRVLATRVQLIPDLTLGTELAAIGACHAQFSVLTPVTVTPSPVSVAAGGTAALKITGTAPFYVQWDAGAPADVYVDSGPQVSFTANAKAQAPKSYVFHVVDNHGTPSDSVTLNVTAAAAPTTPTTPTNPKPKPKPKPKPGAGSGGGGKGPPPSPGGQ